MSRHPPADPGETGKIEGDDGHVCTGSKLAPQENVHGMFPSCPDLLLFRLQYTFSRQ